MANKDMADNPEQVNKKRDREEDVESPDTQGNKHSGETPTYGSKAYWEGRYRRNQEQENGEEAKEEDGPEANHAWYFNYEDLAPILLPLILGDEQQDEEGGASDSNEPRAEDNEEADISDGNEEDASNAGGTGDDSGNQETNRDEDASDEEAEGSDFEEVEMEEEEEGEDEAPDRVGLAKNGPIAILEVGCGDVPLGRDIVSGIVELESQTGVEATSILARVVCLDYSGAVIDAMNAEQKKEQHGSKQTVPLSYECADARKLPHADETFQLILEKGTMDAMLSDSEKGPDNCRSIVAEMARVLTTQGYIAIVSHLNAHVQSGLDWLEQILVPGLRKGAGQYRWSIEVHGSDVPESKGEEDKAPESPGPAVYVVHKGSLLESVEKEKSDSDAPTIPLRFFSY